METIATIIIMTPILVPVAVSVGLDPVHFGVLMMLNLAIGGVTPPLAVGLFTAAKISNIQIEDTFPDVMYVLAVMIAAYAIVLFNPFPVSYTHLRAHETDSYLVCRLLLEK